jgi:nucleoside-diphosphate-sugar epimerase
MNIAILGATSQIAKDLVLSLSEQGVHTLTLYARRPEVVKRWLAGVGLAERYSADGFDAFGTFEHFDAIINFVGVGNPAQAVAMGTSIFDVTLFYDQMVLNYLKAHTDCRYIFASSGAVYGGDFSKPVTSASHAVVPINNLPTSSWYGVAKLYAECRHRALSNHPIVDVRFFNYFSSTQDINDRFLVTDALRAVKEGVKFKTSAENIVRDYMGPEEVHSLICSILNSGPVNVSIDGYTKKAVNKFQMLDAFREKFGLAYEVDDEAVLLNATGSKKNYFSENHLAHDVFGFSPQKTALEIVLQQAEDFLPL